MDADKKMNVWKLVIQALITILTAIGTILGVTSCMAVRVRRNELKREPCIGTFSALFLLSTKMRREEGETDARFSSFFPCFRLFRAFASEGRFPPASGWFRLTLRTDRARQAGRPSTWLRSGGKASRPCGKASVWGPTRCGKPLPCRDDGPHQSL